MGEVEYTSDMKVVYDVLGDPRMFSIDLCDHKCPFRVKHVVNAHSYQIHCKYTAIKLKIIGLDRKLQLGAFTRRSNACLENRMYIGQEGVLNLPGESYADIP